MTFKHKLSVRLALLKDLLLLIPVTALLTCERRLPLANGDPVVTRVAVSPSQLTLDTSQTSALMAVGLTATGDTGNIAMTWSATGGSIVDTFSSGSHHFANYHPSTPGTYRVIATGSPGGMADSSTVTVIQAAVASVTVSPAVAAILVGATLQLTAVTRDAAGNPLTGRIVTWASSNTAVATVSGSGLATGQVAASATITASSEGTSGTSALTIQASGSHAGYYVAPTGSSSGDGSGSRPWDLATALAGGNGKVQPGDTVWMRAGTYRGSFTSVLNGTAAAPIVVRQYPGERATINGNVTLLGSYSWLWGFEITNSAATYTGGIYQQAPGSHLINLVIHDMGASGIFTNPSSPNSEIYGSLIYNNGTNFNLDHGIYANNTTGTKLLADNVVFNNWKYGFHLYSPVAGELTNLYLDGNVAFGNGTISSPPISISAGIIVAGTVAQGLRVTNNYFYEAASTNNWAAQIGTSGGQDMVATGNEFVRYVELGTWNTATVSGNTFYASDMILGTESPTAGFSWSKNNHYRDPSAAAWRSNGSAYTFSGWKSASGLGASDQVTGTRPSGVNVVVRPNRYEAGRANIVVYNWDGLPTVSVDVSAVLGVGDRYEVRNVQDFYGPPVASGVYGGGSIILPMAGITPPAPLGRSYTPAPVTGPEFNVFVVLRTGS